LPSFLSFSAFVSLRLVLIVVLECFRNLALRAWINSRIDTGTGLTIVYLQHQGLGRRSDFNNSSDSKSSGNISSNISSRHNRDSYLKNTRRVIPTRATTLRAPHQKTDTATNPTLRCTRRARKAGMGEMIDPTTSRSEGSRTTERPDQASEYRRISPSTVERVLRARKLQCDVPSST